MSTSPDAFAAWHREANELLNLLESLPGRCRMLASPPPAPEAAERIDALAALWERCKFLPLAPNSPPPWSDRAGVLSHPLSRAPEDFLRNLYVRLGEALALGLRDQATDRQQRVISTQDLPFFTFSVGAIVEKPDRGTAWREQAGRTKLEQEDRLWTAVEVSRLPSDHPLRLRIADPWRPPQIDRLPAAVLGPAIGGKPAPVLAVADVAAWTANLRAPQRFEEMERERRQKADDEERRRAYERSEAARLAKIEAELAAMKQHAGAK